MAVRPEDLIKEGQEYYDEEIRTTDRWELFYHLSSLRKAALSWYPFRKGSRILEAGCGFGALTGALCETGGSVDAVDDNPVNAGAVRKRYAGRDNLRVICTDLREFQPKEPYDYIVFVADERKPVGLSLQEFFARLDSLLAPDGRLLFGFVNADGLEYPGEEGEGICSGGIRLSKERAAAVAAEAGLSDIRFYYPVPDFGFTQAVYSDRWLPKGTIRDRVLFYNRAEAGSFQMAEQINKVYDDAIRDGSFSRRNRVLLAECGREPGSCGVDGAVTSSDREKAYAFLTVIREDGTVLKRALYEEGALTAEGLLRNLEDLSRAGVRTVPASFAAHEAGGREGIVMPFLEKELLVDHIRSLINDAPEKAADVFDMLYQEILKSSPPADRTALPKALSGAQGPVLETGYIDMIPNNAFFDNGFPVFFDQEFTLKGCPAAYILYRALRYTWLHIGEAESKLPLEAMKKRYDLQSDWDLYTVFEDAFTEKIRNRRLFAQLYYRAWGRPPYDTGLVLGTFDLFHEGHRNLLRRAKKRCRRLRVGVMSDDLVFLYKKIRPAQTQEERRRSIEESGLADEVYIVEGDYVSKIDEWRREPFDCFFSGDDYIDHPYWKQEAAELKKLGAEIEFFPYTEGISSTMLREERGNEY